MESILNTIKKKLGIDANCTSFDEDIITEINAVFVILHQLGIGPETPFSIQDDFPIWSEFTDDDAVLGLVKTYIWKKVKVSFDPALSGAAAEADKRVVDELEWRLSIIASAPRSESSGDLT